MLWNKMKTSTIKQPKKKYINMIWYKTKNPSTFNINVQCFNGIVLKTKLNVLRLLIQCFGHYLILVKLFIYYFSFLNDFERVLVNEIFTLDFLIWFPLLYTINDLSAQTFMKYNYHSIYVLISNLNVQNLISSKELKGKVLFGLIY